MRLGDCKRGSIVWHQPDYVTAGTPHCNEVIGPEQWLMDGIAVHRGCGIFLESPDLEVFETPEEAIRHRSKIGYRCPPAYSQTVHYRILQETKNANP